MKLITTYLFSFLLFSPSLVLAGGCDLTKSVYDSKDYAQAYRLANSYKSDGDACVEYYLALMYIHGHGVKMDTEKGLRYMNISADKGYQPAIDFFTKRPT